MWKLISPFLIFVLLMACGCSQPSSLSSRKHHAVRRGDNKPQAEFELELKNQINHLLTQLASEKFRERESAQAQLNRLFDSKPDLAPVCLLEAYETAEDPEVKERLGRMLKPYNAWGITSGILEAIPNILQLLQQDKEESYSAAIQALQKLGSRDACGTLVCIMAEALDDRNEELASLAVGAIANKGAAGMDTLAALLKNASDDVRKLAVSAMGKVKDKRALKHLIMALKDRNEGVRCYAAQVLGWLRAKSAVGPLIKALKDKDAWVRSSAAGALGLIRDRKAVMPLIGALKDDYPNVLQQAIQALLGMPDRRAVDNLIEVLKDQEQLADIRGNAAWVLGQIGDKKAVEPLIAALDDEEPDVRGSAAWILGSFRDARAVEPLIDVLKGKKQGDRAEAARSLGNIGDTRAIKPLIEVLEDKSKGVRLYATRALGEFGDKRAVRPLIERFKDTSWRVRRDAAKAVAEIGADKASENLIDALKDENASVRAYAARALGIMGDKKAVEPLRKLWNESKEDKVRVNAAFALVKMTEDKGVFSFVLKALNKDEWETRANAAWSLGMIADRAAVGPLLKALKDKDWPVRCEAASALGAIGDERAVEALIDTLKGKDWDIHGSASWALRKMTKQDFGGDYEKWKEWFEKSKNK